MSEHFGDKLRHLRREHDWSQQQTVSHLKRNCPELRLSQTALSELEKRATFPRGEVVTKLANAFNVPIEYFYGDLPLDAIEGEDLTRLAARLSALYREFKSAMPEQIQAQFRSLIAVVTEESLK